MPFRENTRMSDVIHANYLLLPVLNRFDIQLGFGDKTIAEVCADHKVDAGFFLEIINSFHDHDYFPQVNLQSFSLQMILTYIRKSHIFYLEKKVPDIERLINQLVQASKESDKKSFQLIEKFFQVYKTELTEHIQNEENHVYPYVLAIDQAYTSGEINEAHFQMITDHSINKFAEEHSNIEDKLFDLKNLIIKYLPPTTDYTLSNSLLTELFRLERDLNDHSRIEDKVLVPKVRHIENVLMKNRR